MTRDVSLVSFETEDGLRLRGLYSRVDRARAVVVHVHGNSGNFYENEFLGTAFEIYGRHGISMLSFNNRGHDVIAEAYRKGRLCYVGGAYERIEECVFDIDAAVAFARGDAPLVVVQGHSFGCLKTVVHAQARNEPLGSCIFLSPADTIELQELFCSPEGLGHQIARIRATNYSDTNSLLPLQEFGIRAGGVEYQIPISVGTYLNFFDGAASLPLHYSRLEDAQRASKCIDRAFVYYGGADPLMTSSPQDVRTFFERLSAHCDFCFTQNGNHHLAAVEAEVFSEAARWVLSL